MTTLFYSGNGGGGRCWPWAKFSLVPSPLVGGKRYLVNFCWMNE